MTLIQTLLGAFLCIILLPSFASAYVDAGTGSLVVQLLVAGFAGLAVLGRVFWNRIKLPFSSSTKEIRETEDVQNPDERKEANLN